MHCLSAFFRFMMDMEKYMSIWLNDDVALVRIELADHLTELIRSKNSVREAI